MKNFKILISALFLYPGKVGGAEHYFYNLLRGFKEIGIEKNIDIIVNSHVKKEFDPVVNNFNLIEVDIKFNRGLYDLFFDKFLRKKVDFNNYDILLSLNYITPLSLKLPVVTVIHDLQYKRFPIFFSIQKRIWLHLNHLITAKKAKKIITISNFVKQEFMKFFGGKYYEKLDVIHNPIDFARFEENMIDTILLKKIGHKKFILSVAANYPHKNILTLIEAFKRIEKNYDYNLILVGQLGKNLIGKYNDYYLKIMNKIKDESNIIITGYLDNASLGYLYKHCELFVFPSLFEGFGMPPVEAMGFGKPTIVSDIKPLKEVTFGKAIYVKNPMDVKNWVQVIENTLDNLHTFSNYFSNIGEEVVNFYSPKKIAYEYMKILDEVINVTQKKNN